MQAVVQVRADRHSQVFLSNTSSVYGLPRLRITVFTHVWKIGLPPCAETAKSGKPQETAGGVKGAYRPLASASPNRRVRAPRNSSATVVRTAASGRTAGGPSSRLPRFINRKEPLEGRGSCCLIYTYGLCSRS